MARKKRIWNVDYAQGKNSMKFGRADSVVGSIRIKALRQKIIDFNIIIDGENLLLTSSEQTLAIDISLNALLTVINLLGSCVHKMCRARYGNAGHYAFVEARHARYDTQWIPAIVCSTRSMV